MEDFKQRLIACGQKHLFHANPTAEDRENEEQILKELWQLHSENPTSGGLFAYLERAKSLLDKSKNGHNSLDKWRPTDQDLTILEPLSEQFMALEHIGIQAVGRCAFILVAGGLGERLGYPGIKVELPVETVSKRCYLQHYCRQIVAIQTRYGSPDFPLPLVVMVSEDTEQRTMELFIENDFFGLIEQQVCFVKQGKVPALMNNHAHIALSSDGKHVESKPHGHGDIHALLWRAKLPTQWLEERHVEYCLFFQDTNALGFLSLPIMLGKSIVEQLDMNSMAVPRKAKQAVGAIVSLVNTEDPTKTMTTNIEYNLLDPLLRATCSPAGDTNDDRTGYSPYPGNINMLLLRLSSYVAVLQATDGLMEEFVNPKYADSSRETFKKPTRLECMMQDIAKSFCRLNFRVGYTQAPAWFCYNPCKNNAADAVVMFAQGVPGGAPMIAESQQYYAYRELFRRIGCTVEEDNPHSFLGLSAVLSPCIVIDPWCALFVSEIQSIFPNPERVHLNHQSTLIIECDDEEDGSDGTSSLRIHSLQLSGRLDIRLKETETDIGQHEGGLSVCNGGDQIFPYEGVCPIYTIRGYEVITQEQLIMNPLAPHQPFSFS